MIHVQYQDKEENVGLGPGFHKNDIPDQQSIVGISVPTGYKAVFYENEDKTGWKSYIFYEGVYPELFVYGVPEVPGFIEVSSANYKPNDFVKIDNIIYVVEDKEGRLVDSYPAYTQRRRLKQGHKRREVNAYLKLPARDKPYFGGEDFPDDSTDRMYVPTGISVQVYNRKGNPGDIHKYSFVRSGSTRTIDNSFRTYTGSGETGTNFNFRSMRRHNRASAMRIAKKEVFVEEKQKQEEDRIEGEIIPIIGEIPKDPRRNNVGRYEVKTGRWSDEGRQIIEWDFGTIEWDWYGIIRSNEGTALKSLSIYARHGAIVAAWIWGEQTHAYNRRGYKNFEFDSSYRPAIVVELKDGKKVDVDSYTDVIYHQVEPLRGIYHIYDWIEWVRKDDDENETVVFKVNVKDVKRIYLKR